MLPTPREVVVVGRGLNTYLQVEGQQPKMAAFQQRGGGKRSGRASWPARVTVLKHRYCARSLRTLSISASAICGMFSKLPADWGDTT